MNSIVWDPGLGCDKSVLNKPRHWRKPRMVYIKCDLFDPMVPFEHDDQVFAIAALAPQHTYQIKTEWSRSLRDQCKEAKRVMDDFHKAMGGEG